MEFVKNERKVCVGKCKRNSLEIKDKNSQNSMFFKQMMNEWVGNSIIQCSEWKYFVMEIFDRHSLGSPVNLGSSLVRRV